MVPELRSAFNRSFTGEAYLELLAQLTRRCGSAVRFRVAETPIFVEKPLLEEMADQGSAMTRHLMSEPS